MAKIVVFSPLPAALVTQWLVARMGRCDATVASAHDLSADALLPELATAELALGDYTFQHPMGAELLAAAPRLRFIQQPSVGYQHIDLDACTDRGVLVANTPGVNDAAVAEHTLMFALMLLRHACTAHERTSHGQWAQQELIWGLGVRELAGKAFGIIGMGRIGRELARRLIAFQTRTLYYDLARLPQEVETELHVTYKPLDHLLRLSDVVSLHVPLTAETRGLLSAEKLALMKFDAVLINVARGECVDEAALARRLRERKLAGAGIDVFSTEPIVADHPLLALENVVLTPHIAGATAEVRERVAAKAVGNLACVLAGNPPEHVLNPQALSVRSNA